MSKSKTIISALFCTLLWGTLFPMIKLGYNAYNITTTGDILLFAGVRFTICGGVICLWLALNDRHSLRLKKDAVMPVLLSGLFAIILHYSFTYLGLLFTDSSKTALLKQTGMLFYVCFSFLFFKNDRFTLRKFICAVMGFSGIIAMNTSSIGVSFTVGDALIICASFCIVFSNVISKKAFNCVSPVVLTGISQLFGGIILLILGVALGGHMEFNIAESYILLYMCAVSVASYCIWYAIMEKGELSKLFIIKFAEPVFACIFGALILGEDIFKIQYLIAFLLIAGGIYFSNNKE